MEHPSASERWSHQRRKPSREHLAGGALHRRMQAEWRREHVERQRKCGHVRRRVVIEQELDVLPRSSSRCGPRKAGHRARKAGNIAAGTRYLRAAAVQHAAARQRIALVVAAGAVARRRAVPAGGAVVHRAGGRRAAVALLDGRLLVRRALATTGVHPLWHTSTRSVHCRRQVACLLCPAVSGDVRRKGGGVQRAAHSFRTTVHRKTDAF